MFLERYISKIYLILGVECNLQCKYCMQKDNPFRQHLSEFINPDIYTFFKEVVEYQNRPFTLIFYGGEPLFFYNKIEEIVKNTKDLNLEYAIITNGTLLDKNKIKFINENNIKITLSWDGRNTSSTRNIDIFKDDFKNLLFQINNLSITSVFSGYNSIMELIEDQQKIVSEYYRLNNKTIDLNIDIISSFPYVDEKLAKIDINRYLKEIKPIIEKALYAKEHSSIDKETFTLNYYAIYSFVDSLLQTYLFNKQCDDLTRHYLPRCNNGYSTLNMDTSGTFYNCHNTYDVVGNLHSDYYSMLNNIIQLDKTKESYQNYCRNCKVYSICNGGCKLIDKGQDKEYCRLRKELYSIVIKKFEEHIKMGDKQ